MEFSMLHAGLAAGAAFAAIPVILHLFMRQTPKRVIFPALRLIRERQKRSKKRLRVKNWLLLLARMALLALMALALARPRITSEASTGDDQVQSAIALVFDTSLSMTYVEHDKSKLDLAKAQAAEILKKTPSTSQIFVVDSSEPVTPSPLSPPTALTKINELTTKAVSRPLNLAVGSAYAGVMTSELEVREVYVFTDLARSAWDMEHPVEGLDKVHSSKKDVRTFIVRLNSKEINNVSIAEATLIGDRATENEPVEIAAKLRSVGPATERVVELWIDGTVKARESVKIEKNAEVDLVLKAPKVDPSIKVHQGEVRLTGAPDALSFDDRRFFTFNVKPAIHVLIVSDYAIDADFIGDAIAPEMGSDGKSGPIVADRIRSNAFSEKSQDLGKAYRCIFINNAGGLTEADWSKLAVFARDGGGLVISLGQRSHSENADSPFASIAPAALDKKVKPKAGTTFGSIVDLTNPLFAKYRKPLEAMLSTIPVMEYWQVHPKEDSHTLLEYADKAPALLERVFKGSKEGRVLLWTTPLSRRPEVGSADAWNEFPNEALGWSFYYLMNQTVAYLAGTAEENLNFQAGLDVILPLDPSLRPLKFLVRGPDKRSSDPLQPGANSNSLVIIAPQEIGNWTVEGTYSAGSGESLGFSVNSSPEESQYVTLEAGDLAELFGGKDRFALADDPESLVRIQDLKRIGRELFPWFMILIMFVVTIESIMSNRFYKGSST